MLPLQAHAPLDVLQVVPLWLFDLFPDDVRQHGVPDISSLCSTQECSDYLKNIGLLGFHRFDIMSKGPIGLQTYGRSISNDERTFLYFARFSK